jgi:hypothetical protein
MFHPDLAASRIAFPSRRRDAAIRTLSVTA